jgi:L-fuculose-phosphate aldolase
MPDARKLAEAICDVGRRMAARQLVAGTDGNLSVRLTESEVLSTPTGQNKGTLSPDDICLVDMEGNQLGGTKRRSSEILLHLAILRARPDVNGVVHCHAPHASAFAATHTPLPRGILPEAEFFLGEIPLAPFETPGTAEFAATVLPFVHRTNVCLLANHGIVTYANSLEQAYALTEMLDAYCRIVLLAAPLGPLVPLPADKWEEIRAMSRQAGFTPAIAEEKS